MTDLIMEKTPKSPTSEAYRSLRTNIEFSSIDKEIKTILITSSAPGEGKSTTSCNLALAYAQAGKKTLIIDCDLRKPSIHKMFKISNRIGLTNMFADNFKFADAVHSFNEYLDILPSGTIPPNPSEILSSQKMRAFIEKVSGVYDRVILDSPPLNAVTDAQILSGIVDGVILVVSSGTTDIEESKRAKEMLVTAKANILGVVLCRVKSMGKKYGYYYYGDEDKKSGKRKKSRV